MKKVAGIVLGILVVVLWYYLQGERDSAPTGEPPPLVPAATTQPATAGMIDDQRIINSASEPGNWLAYGRDYEGHRFSPLTEINRDTVAELGLAWYRDMGTNHTSEATPIIDNGVMYTTSAWSRVFAIEVDSGELLWRYDPQVSGEYARKTCCDVINRGAAVYQGKVYVGALDGRLHAIDATTGEKAWEVDTIVDRDLWYSITGAPLAAAGKIFIGNSGSEFGTRGYVSAYDAETGELAWRFYTVPGDPDEPFEHPEMEMAAKTWTGEWWKGGGGGTVWNSIVYDPEFNQVYLGVGNGAPWARAIRSPGGGDNLFLVSIVAVDADTGRMNWYYQQVPAEDWDYTATADMALAEMEVDGKQRKVLLQAPKNGFFYVLDRATGELLRAHPFVPVTWATHVDMETGRPVENPDVHYLEGTRFIQPGPLGGHNWQAMSVDVEASLVYMGVMEGGLLYGLDEEFRETGSMTRRKGLNLGIELPRLTKMFSEYEGEIPPTRGFLKAFDPLTGTEEWAVELPHSWNGGVLGTAGGLVFQGDATGHFTAYDKTNGEQLWQFNAFSSILAPPVTFAHDGVQYVSVMTGSGGGNQFGAEGGDPDTWVSAKYGNTDRLLVFKLGGEEELPRATIVDQSIPRQDLQGATEQRIATGEDHYARFCVTCHGLGVRSAGSVPDLRRMSAATHELFNSILLDGIYASNGMAAFDDVFSVEDVENIHLFIRARAEEDRLVAAGEKEQARQTWIK
jgi:PQQ-dependent dehydrogenase (methanol/ethanol family)